MMYQRTDLTLSMFYASSADADGNKVATLTMQVIAAEVGAVQTSQLRCITDSAKKKTYSVGEQSVSNGSDPLLVAIENYWRQSTDVVVKGLIAEVTDFIAGNINSVSTWIGQFGMKVFENQPLDERLPESVLQADGGSATQIFGYTHQSLHRIVRIADHSGTKKQPFNVVTTIEFHRQFHQFRNGKCGAGKIVATPVNTVGTVVDTIIGKHDFQ